MWTVESKSGETPYAAEAFATWTRPIARPRVFHLEIALKKREQIAESPSTVIV